VTIQLRTTASLCNDKHELFDSEDGGSIYLTPIAAHEACTVGASRMRVILEVRAGMWNNGRTDFRELDARRFQTADDTYESVRVANAAAAEAVSGFAQRFDAFTLRWMLWAGHDLDFRDQG